MTKEFRGGRHQQGAAQRGLREESCEPLRAAAEVLATRAPEEKESYSATCADVSVALRMAAWVARRTASAIYVSREIAERDVEHLGRFRIPAEVVEDGRYFRVKTYPIPPEGTH